MNIKITGFLAAILMLAAPCAHAGIGSFISSILPAKMRASDEIRSHVDTAVNHLKIKRPVFILNTPLEDGTGAETENHLLYSVVRFNKNQMAEFSEYARLHAAYHEMGHVAHDHARRENVLKTTTSNACFLALYIPPYAIFNRHRLTSSNKHKLLAVSALSLLTVCAYANIPDRSAEEKLTLVREWELQAEKVAFELMAKTHGTADLEKRLSYLKKIEEKFDSNYRDRGDEYPTIAQETALIRQVMAINSTTS